MNVTPIGGVSQTPPVDMNLSVQSTNTLFDTTSLNSMSFSSNEAFMADVIKAFQHFGFDMASALATTTNSTLDIHHALNNFVHSLQVALDRSDQDTSEDASAAPQAGFNSFIEDLVFLIASNNSSLLQSGSSPLQSNFDTFLNQLSVNSSINNTANPTLTDFLTMMLLNLQTDQLNQNNVGTSLVTEI